MSAYCNEAVAGLAKELAAGLLRLRKGYIDAAEALAGILDPAVEYPYEFVLYRLTAYRPLRRGPIDPISGEDLHEDLPRLILDLCDSFDLPVTAYPEKVHTTEQLARRFRVSTKTIQRWRHRGLVARRLVFPGGRKRVGFLESSVRNFSRGRRRLISRSVHFTKMARAEREDVIRQAKRIVARTGCGLYEVSKRLASRTGRAVETIRYTIRRHDRENPAAAVFPDLDVPLDAHTREVIYRSFLHGVPVTSLGRRYRRTRGTIYRVVNEMRARQLLARKIDSVYNPQFDLPGAEEMILSLKLPPAPQAGPPRRRSVPKDLPPYLQSLYDVPLLSGEQEQHLFRKFNYLKHRADQLRGKLNPASPRASLLRRIERLLVQADAVKNAIIRANLRLVVSIAKKHLSGPQTLFELISDGNLSLMAAVKNFDYSRGFKFSTYASWAIRKNFARSVPRQRYLMDRYVTGVDEILDLVGAAYDPGGNSVTELRESLDVVLAQLQPRERSIIVRHFGLDQSGKPQTLEQLSRQLGISKERVRQLEHRAMRKLRQMLQPDRAQLMR